MFATRAHAIALALLAAVTCGACANDPLATSPMSLGAGTLAQERLDLQAMPKPVSNPANQPTPKFKKTIADKMLAASALERVTGRKPDPSRFSDINTGVK